nr:hypothetical protein [Spirochaetota bacterium]
MQDTTLNSKRIIRIGTRGSELALWQAHYVRDILGKDNTEVIIIKTQATKYRMFHSIKWKGKDFS